MQCVVNSSGYERFENKDGFVDGFSPVIHNKSFFFALIGGMCFLTSSSFSQINVKCEM